MRALRLFRCPRKCLDPSGCSLLFFGVLLSLWTACQQGEEPPADLIDRPTFTAMLAEAQLIEAERERGMVLDSGNTLDGIARYDELAERFDVTTEQFRASFEHYAEDPDVLRSIYEDVLVELSKKKDSGE